VRDDLVLDVPLLTRDEHITNSGSIVAVGPGDGHFLTPQSTQFLSKGLELLQGVGLGHIDCHEVRMTVALLVHVTGAIQYGEVADKRRPTYRGVLAGQLAQRARLLFIQAKDILELVTYLDGMLPGNRVSEESITIQIPIKKHDCPLFTLLEEEPAITTPLILLSTLEGLIRIGTGLHQVSRYGTARLRLLVVTLIVLRRIETAPLILRVTIKTTVIHRRVTSGVWSAKGIGKTTALILRRVLRLWLRLMSGLRVRLIIWLLVRGSETATLILRRCLIVITYSIRLVLVIRPRLPVTVRILILIVLVLILVLRGCTESCVLVVHRLILLFVLGRCGIYALVCLNVKRHIHLMTVLGIPCPVGLGYLGEGLLRSPHI